MGNERCAQGRFFALQSRKIVVYTGMDTFTLVLLMNDNTIYVQGARQ